MWQPIETAPWRDGWLSKCLVGRMESWGWNAWVGQCDAGDIWLAWDGEGCSNTEPPTHWCPIPPFDVETA